MMTTIGCFFGAFFAGLIVGAWRAGGEIAVCRDCLKKLPIREEF